MPKQSEITLGAIGVIDGIAGLPTIAWPNVDFDTENVDEYIRVYILPAESESDSLGCDEFIGLIQASVYVRDGSGIIDATGYTDAIRAAFTKSLEITNGTTKFKITKTGWDAPMLVDGGWCQIPVSIPYKSFGSVVVVAADYLVDDSGNYLIDEAGNTLIA